MIFEIYIGGIWLKYSLSIEEVGESPVYPFLEEIPLIRESTVQESGNSEVKLSLNALALLTNLNGNIPLGLSARLREKDVILFNGIVTDFIIENSITIQLEA